MLNSIILYVLDTMFLTSKNSWQHLFLSNLPAGMRVNTHGVSDTPSLFSAQHCTTPKSFSDSAL